MVAKKITQLLLETGKEVASATSDTIEHWHMEAAQRKQAELAAQATKIRLQNSVGVQRDLARIMQGMIPPDGLTYVNDPRNLTFLPNYNNNDHYYSFWWQKTRRKIAFSETTLLSLARRINNRILQMPDYLFGIGYSEQELAADYPALYNGFAVVDMRDSDDGVIITIRIN